MFSSVDVKHTVITTSELREGFNVRFKLHAHTEETLLRCYTMRTTECGVGVGWDVNVRLRAHTEEALLRCYTMRTTECGVGVGWDVGVRSGSNCTLMQKKPFYVATQY